MKIIDVKRLCVFLTFTGDKAIKVKELWQKAKQLNPKLTQVEIFLIGLEQILKKHS